MKEKSARLDLTPKQIEGVRRAVSFTIANWNSLEEMEAEGEEMTDDVKRLRATPTPTADDLSTVLTVIERASADAEARMPLIDGVTLRSEDAEEVQNLLEWLTDNCDALIKAGLPQPPPFRRLYVVQSGVNKAFAEFLDKQRWTRVPMEPVPCGDGKGYIYGGWQRTIGSATDGLTFQLFEHVLTYNELCNRTRYHWRLTIQVHAAGYEDKWGLDAIDLSDRVYESLDNAEAEVSEMSVKLVGERLAHGDAAWFNILEPSEVQGAKGEPQ